MSDTVRVGKFDPDSTISWSDGSTFSGYLYIALVPPTYGTNDDATSLEIAQLSPPCVVPNRIPVPVINGKINNSLGLFYNADLRPPNSRYKYCLYDTTKRQVSSFSSYFTVSSETITLPSVTATVPTSGTNVPQPNS